MAFQFGAGVGGYFAYANNEVFSILVGTIAGYVIGYVVKNLLGRLAYVEIVWSINTIVHFAVGVLGIILALISIVIYFLSGDWIGVASFLFFGLCGVFLINIASERD